MDRPTQGFRTCGRGWNRCADHRHDGGVRVRAQRRAPVVDGRAAHDRREEGERSVRPLLDALGGVEVHRTQLGVPLSGDDELGLVEGHVAELSANTDRAAVRNSFLRDAYTATEAAPRADCRASARQTYSEIPRGVGTAFDPPVPWARGWEPRRCTVLRRSLVSARTAASRATTSKRDATGMLAMV